jgi:EmrB/QacA subfamily drug resistance transporter
MTQRDRRDGEEDGRGGEAQGRGTDSEQGGGAAGVAGDQPAGPAPRPFSRMVPLVVAGALFIEFLDSTIVSTALPAMAKELGVPAPSLSLTITVYLVSLAVLVPASGWIADRLGARRVLVAALCVFLTGSIVCGASQSMSGLLLGRAIQGAAGALMMPVGRLIVLKTVPRQHIMQAWIWLTMPALMGPMIGPVLGGFIVTAASWRWIFWVNVPIGIAGAILAYWYLPPVREDRVPKFDTLGFVLSSTAIACGVFALEAMGRKVLPGWFSLLLAATAAASLALYLRHAKRHPEPIIDTSLFALPTFRAAIIGGSIFRIAVGAAPFLIPLLLQVGFGQSALKSGLTTFVGAMGAMAVKPAVAALLGIFGFRRMLIVNALLAAVLTSSLALATAATPQFVLMLLIFVGGFFRSLEFTTLATISYADVDRDKLSRATTIAGMMQQISMSVGVALGAGLLHAIPAVRGASEVTTGDYSLAIFLVALVSATSALIFRTMPANAGASLIGKS